ncbi:hypothetical protein [Pandoraea sp. NPDC087047]|uniref:hypothetical protein n=1 Tax=Pandoraea sp. NPDC087047 TaxID=3364390 RepID=UPI00381D1958
MHLPIEAASSPSAHAYDNAMAYSGYIVANASDYAISLRIQVSASLECRPRRTDPTTRPKTAIPALEFNRKNRSVCAPSSA